MVDWFTLEGLLDDFEAIARAYPEHVRFVVKLWPYGIPSIDEIRAALADRGWSLCERGDGLLEVDTKPGVESRSIGVFAKQGDWKGPDRIRA